MHTCIDTIEHKFWDCREVHSFWENIARLINSLDIVPDMVLFTAMKIFLGVSNDRVITKVISIGKSMISKRNNLNVKLFTVKLKIEIANEKCMAQNRGKMDRFKETWGNVANAIANI